MMWDRQGARRRSNDTAGMTLVEALVMGGILLAALLLFLWAVGPAATRARREACRRQLTELYSRVHYYMNVWDEFLPPAWHVSGRSVAIDLSNLAYHRLLLHCEQLSRFGDGTYAGAQRPFREDALFWSDPALGWTRDYFGPEIVFKMPEEQGKTFDGHAQYHDLTEDISAAERPLFTEVNASVPDPASDAEANGGETRSGIAGRFTNVFGLDAFFGVARSQRVEGDLSTLRFDFRHGGAANVVFLDGHVECVKADDRARLEQISRNWDHLKPPAEAPPN